MGLAISVEVKSILDDYMQNGKPLAIGYETHGINVFADMCHRWFDRQNLPRLVKIKQECCQFSKRKEYEYRKALEEKEIHYFDGMWNYRFVWSRRLKNNGHYIGTVQAKVEHACMRYMVDHTEDYAMKYIVSEYGNLEQAIQNTDNFIQLWNGYARWFDERRKRFMEKMEVDIQKSQGVSNKKTPQSHGGVANLLKILTKTMEQQGSDIRSIAKVQYAVCVQAGIYIPDEFIRDVAVALDITESEVENK